MNESGEVNGVTKKYNHIQSKIAQMEDTSN